MNARLVNTSISWSRLRSGLGVGTMHTSTAASAISSRISIDLRYIGKIIASFDSGNWIADECIPVKNIRPQRKKLLPQQEFSESK